MARLYMRRIIICNTEIANGGESGQKLSVESGVFSFRRIEFPAEKSEW